MPGQREWIDRNRTRSACNLCVRLTNGPGKPMATGAFKSGSNENMVSRSIINASYDWWESSTFVRLPEKGTPIDKSKIGMGRSIHTLICCVRISRPDARMKNGAQTLPTSTPDKDSSTWPSSRTFLTGPSWDMPCPETPLFTWFCRRFNQQPQVSTRSREWSFKVTRGHNSNPLLIMRWLPNLGSSLPCHAKETA